MISKTLKCCLICWLLPVFCPAWAWAALPVNEPGGPISIDADSISYDREADAYQARGQVRITFPGGTLQADSLLLEKGANIASATGHVIVRTEGDVLEGDRVVFDITTNRGVVYAGKMFIAQNHFYLKGDKIEKTGEATYHIQEASLSTCDGEAPDWRFTGREMDVTIDGYGTIKDGKFLVGNVPLLYIPYFLFPAKTTRQTGFLFPRLAYSRDKLGFDAELPFYLAVSSSADATFYQRYMDKRGFKEGVEFRYFLNKDSYGVIYGDYLDDSARIKEQSGNLTRDWQSDQNRWSFYLQNYTALQPGLYLRADIARVSDNWYFKDFTSHNYYLDHYAQDGGERFKKVSFVADESLAALESKVRLVKDWSLYNLTTLVNYTDDLTSPDNAATVQKYPEITLTGVTQSFFGTPLNFGLNASYSGNYPSSGQKGELVDLQPHLSLPLDMGGLFRLIPEAEIREQFWERNDDPAIGDSKRGNSTAYRLGLDAITSVFRDFTLPGPVLEKVRHEIKPELTYTYLTSIDQAKRPDFADAVREQNTVTAALTNTLMARLRGKNGTTNYIEILRFKLAQSFDINEARRNDDGSTQPRRPFGDLDLELDFKPATNLAFYVRNRFDVNEGRWDKANYDLQLADERGDAASLGYRYTRDLLEEVNLSLKVLVTKALDLSYVLRRNEFDNRSLSNALGFHYSSQCWSVGLSYDDAAGDRTFTLSFSLTGLGGVGGR